MEVGAVAVEQIAIVSFNVRGMRSRVKRRAVFRHIRINYPHSIAILQETHSLPDMETRWKCEWAGRIYFSHGTENSQAGVAILFPRNFAFDTEEVVSDPDGRVVCVKIGLLYDPVVIMGVYAPAIDDQTVKCRFLDDLRELLLCFGNNKCFLAGDLNIRLSNLDCNSLQFRSTRACKKLLDILEEFSLDDSWRCQHPGSRKFTWRKITPLQQSRIDYIFVSHNIINNNVVKTGIDTGILSDHNFAYISVEMCTDKRGPGTWRYNNTLLDDHSHIDDIRTEISYARDSIGVYCGDISKGVKVEMLLSNIRVHAIRRSKQLAHEFRLEEKSLYKRANELETVMANDPSADEISEYETVKKTLDEAKEKRGKAAILSSQAVWMEFGEKSNSYFMRLAKIRAAQIQISTLIANNGEVVRGNKPILDTCVSHYKSIYESKRNNDQTDLLQSFALDDTVPRLNENDKKLCEGSITKEECKFALSQMARNKTAGISGFTAEFFAFFWGDFGDIIVDYINDAKASGQLFISHRRGVLKLVPKKGNQMLLKNKRPICLLDVLYKLIAKVMAIRLSRVIDQIVDKNQTGFIRGRYIGENLRLVADVIEYCNMDDQEGILLAIDFRNAFDTLEHQFMIHALECFNFGPDFVAWIRLLYTDAYLTVSNNGFTSTWFPCTRGTFQGSPLSGSLFDIAVELLAWKIRKSADIEGIVINNTEIKVSQYADDTTLLLKNQGSVERTFELLAQFKEISGLEINRQKTNAMWLGRHRNKRDPVCEIEACSKVKILGMWFSASEQCVDDNVAPVITNIKNTINSWSQRNLTIKGRIVITKTLLASKLVYLALTSKIPNVDLKEIQSHIMKFVWRGRPPKVALSTLCQDTKQGGLKAVDVKTFYESLRLTWIRRMTTSTEANWRQLLQARLGDFMLEDVLRANNCKTLFSVQHC